MPVEGNVQIETPGYGCLQTAVAGAAAQGGEGGLIIKPPFLYKRGAQPLL